MRIFLFTILAGLGIWAGGSALAEPELECQYTYAGETKVLKVDPVQDPYIVEPLKVGSYFWLKIVYIKPPSDLAGINIYGYYPLGDGLALAHQWRLLPPFPNPSDAQYGFTGLNYVYEPKRHSELQYWCRFK